MLPCDRPEKPRKLYIIPKKSKKRIREEAEGLWVKKQPKPIPKVSEKRKKENQQYEKERKAFIIKNPKCQFLQCFAKSVDIHHCYSGKDRSKYFLDTSTWKAVCREHHRIIHDVLTKEEAILLGLKLTE